MTRYRCKYCQLHDIVTIMSSDVELEMHIEKVHQPFEVYLGNSEAMTEENKK